MPQPAKMSAGLRSHLRHGVLFQTHTEFISCSCSMHTGLLHKMVCFFKASGEHLLLREDLTFLWRLNWWVRPIQDNPFGRTLSQLIRDLQNLFPLHIMYVIMGVISYHTHKPCHTTGKGYRTGGRESWGSSYSVYHTVACIPRNTNPYLYFTLHLNIYIHMVEKNTQTYWLISLKILHQNLTTNFSWAFRISSYPV